MDKSVAARRYQDGTVGIMISGLQDPDVLSILEACRVWKTLGTAINAAKELENIFAPGLLALSSSKRVVIDLAIEIICGLSGTGTDEALTWLIGEAKPDGEHHPDVNFTVQKRPYREPGQWYWAVVDRRNGLSTMKRFPTPEAAKAVADKLNGENSA